MPDLFAFPRDDQQKKKSTLKNIFLIDGNSFIYRAYHAIKELSNSQGLPTNAIYGFTNMLLKIIKEKAPDGILIAFDSPAPTERHRIYEEYKAQRPETPGDLIVQIPYIRNLVKALRIKTMEIEGCEADDILATLASEAAAEGIEVFIVTGDKDMLQILNDKVKIYDPMKNRVISKDDVIKRFGIPPERIPEMMALTGDTIDNIPGVKGIGEKIASELLQNHSLEELLENPEVIEKKRIRDLIKNNIETIRMSLDLARIRSDIPIELDYEECRTKEPDWDELLEIFRSLEFGSLVKMIPPRSMDVPVRVINNLEDIRSFKKRVEESIVINSYLVNPVQHEPVGIGLGSISEDVWFLYSGSNNHDKKEHTIETIISELRDIFESSDIAKISHDIKKEYIILKRHGINMKGMVYDTMIASYLLNPNKSSHSLNETTLDYLYFRKRDIDDLTSNKRTIYDIDRDDLMDIARTDIAVIKKLKKELFMRLKSEGLFDIYRDIEMPLIDVLASMELTGIKVDIKKLHELSKQLQRQLIELQRMIYDLAQEEFNINSPQQLSRILFEKLGLKPRKKTKTGYSTEVKVLEELSMEHELPSLILQWRTLTKLKSTYIDALPRLINRRTGRIHTTFNQAVTSTGRLSSSDPNLQNIPIRGELGRLIRAAFVADEGYYLLSADYSQIELRILAHLSGDQGLIDAFKRGEDIHTRTASELFGVSERDVTAEMRRVAKTVNFGIVYGISAYGLSESIGTSVEEAQSYIERYFNTHEGVRHYIERIIEMAKKHGYVKTLFGRKRAIPELNAASVHQRNLGERLAMNTPVQGTAADIIKLAMISIHRRIRERNLKSRLILQVHDELLLEVKENELDEIKDIVKEEMEGVIRLDVPLTVEIGFGKDWAEAHN
ncbi:MAG: DNA polymerase I [Nitrospirae bacterium]|nr:DNA polymerase I [Nitrospirota bacterium]